MANAGGTMQLKRLPTAKIKRRAKQLGVTPEAYLKRLVEEDLALDKEARETPWEELVAPYQEALGKLSEKELDDLVEEARRAPAKKRRRA